MLLIGITGPTGAGKTTALRELSALGAELIDADALYHALLESDAALNAALCARFPSAYRGGALDRKALGAIVFGDKAALAELNAIIIPFVNAETLRRIRRAEEAGRPAVALDAINLIGSALFPLCAHTVAIVAPDTLRLARIMARDGIDEGYARSRLAAQPPCEYYSSHCTHTLVNAGDQTQFAAEARALFTRLLQQSRQPPQQ